MFKTRRSLHNPSNNTDCDSKNYFPAEFVEIISSGNSYNDPGCRRNFKAQVFRLPPTLTKGLFPHRFDDPSIRRSPWISATTKLLQPRPQACTVTRFVCQGLGGINTGGIHT